MIKIRESNHDKEYSEGAKEGRDYKSKHPHIDASMYAIEQFRIGIVRFQNNYFVKGFLDGSRGITESLSPRLNQVEEVLSKYEAKDYFDTNAMADSFVKQWEALGCPEEVKGLPGKATAEAIKKFILEREHNTRMEWLKKMVQKFDAKDKEEIIPILRSSEKLTKEIFGVVTGKNVNSMTNAQLKDTIDEWCK